MSLAPLHILWVPLLFLTIEIVALYYKSFQPCSEEGVGFFSIHFFEKKYKTLGMSMIA